MSHWPITVVAFSSLGVALPMPSLADNQQTGTRLESRTARPTAVYVNKPSAIDEILKLIVSGRNHQAVALAREHVGGLRSMQRIEEPLKPSTLYFALNALCVALTTTGQTEEALTTCSDAIAEAPRAWAAWNSRGTTHYADFNFAAALADFERALALAPRDRDTVDTIQGNIRLANERLRGH